MPKVTEEHRAEMRERIQRAALTCIGVHGFSATSMADVIRESGLSAGAVYLYYKSKDDLLLDVGRTVMRIRLGMLDSLPEQRPLPHPAQAIATVVESIPEHSTFPGLPVQVWGEAVRRPELRDAVLGILDEATEHINRYLVAWLADQAGFSRDDAAAASQRLCPAFIGLVQGYMVQVSVGADPRETHDRYLAGVDALLSGVLAARTDTAERAKAHCTER
ncbi:TetR/AcrR family transcriptional regulator [Kocuria sp.]|uniref:TetR/AcrR family transcriptional regulator n=1 Tax=Kocuria sp. TaxID=1871328 RepID=UPI0026DB79A0|nr:TetR/AcrR family transcriptional regulator [Kocuria sp.]MDO4919389.1 TetR/AcrR family transcriptional regulator [Kocuria sp.]